MRRFFDVHVLKLAWLQARPLRFRFRIFPAVEAVAPSCAILRLRRFTLLSFRCHQADLHQAQLDRLRLAAWVGFSMLTDPHQVVKLICGFPLEAPFHFHEGA